MRELYWLEIKLLLRSRGAVALMLVFFALLAAAAASGFQREAARAQVVQTLLREDAGRLDRLREDLRGIEAKTIGPKRYGDPRQAGRIGRTLGVREAVLPPGALGWLALGVADVQPWHYTVSTYHRSAFADEYELRNPMELQAGALDLAFVIGWVLPLVLIALGYDWLARDRETGRGTLLLGSPGAVPRAALARLAALATVPGLAAVGLAAVSLSSAGLLEASALAALVLAYGLLWIALLFAFNLWFARAATIATALTMVWLASCAVAPALLDAGLRTAAPLPSRLELLTSERRALVESDRRHSELLARYLHDHPEAADPKDKVDVPEFLLRSTIQHREIDALVEPLRRSLETGRARQQGLLDRLQWLSPAVVLSEAMAALAGNDARRHAAFEDAVADLHRRWSAHFFPLVIAKARFTAADADRLPRFEFSEPGGGAARAGWAALFLAVCALAAGALALPRLGTPFQFFSKGP